MKLLACIAFNYNIERLVYLRKVLQMQQYLAPVVHTVVTTTTSNANDLATIMAIAPKNSERYNFSVQTFELPNPWLLPWAHKVVMARNIEDKSYTHFMYSEDDIEVSPINIKYWLNARDELRSYGLYPSFLRVEWNEKLQGWTSTDNWESISISKSPVAKIHNSNYHYINLINPYQAMFFYDRDLMLEHTASVTFDVMKYGQIENIDKFPGWGGGGVAERANYAQTFMNVPSGFTSRNVVPFFEKYVAIDPCCFVHHLPNNYANSLPHLNLGKLLVRDILNP